MATADPKTPAADKPAKATKPYTVLSVPVRHNGELFAVGATVPLTDKEAERLGGLVAPVPAK